MFINSSLESCSDQYPAEPREQELISFRNPVGDGKATIGPPQGLRLMKVVLLRLCSNSVESVHSWRRCNTTYLATRFRPTFSLSHPITRNNIIVIGCEVSIYLPIIEHYMTPFYRYFIVSFFDA